MKLSTTGATQTAPPTSAPALMTLRLVIPPDATGSVSSSIALPFPSYV
ncbi:MAG: hypothetical protein ACRDZP_05200 [Acidimicrobiales bacterium]